LHRIGLCRAACIGGGSLRIVSATSGLMFTRKALSSRRPRAGCAAGFGNTVGSRTRRRHSNACAQARRSVNRAGRVCIDELPDGVRDPAPDGHTVVIAGRRELVNARGAFLERSLAIALEHQGGGAPDVDLGNHAVRFPRADRRLQDGSAALELGAFTRHLLCESPPLRHVVPHHTALA
jgi:hypothetical protein